MNTLTTLLLATVAAAAVAGEIVDPTEFLGG